jgi:hypothetical protein
VHPTNRKVYLILLSVAFSGLFKSQGAEVKLMVCKTDSKQNAQICMETNFFFFKMQNQQLFKKILFLFFQISQDFMQQIQKLSLRSMSYLYFEHVLKNLCKRLLSKLLTQQLNLQTKKKRQEKKKIFLLQNNATRKNDDKIKTKRMKRKLWLKAQIANRIRA